MSCASRDCTEWDEELKGTHKSGANKWQQAAYSSGPGATLCGLHTQPANRAIRRMACWWLSCGARLVRVDAAICEQHQHALRARPQRLEQLPRLLHRQRDVGAAVHAVLRGEEVGARDCIHQKRARCAIAEHMPHDGAAIHAVLCNRMGGRGKQVDVSSGRRAGAYVLAQL